MARERGGPSVVSMLTDFASADGYVAAMKGVILGINREVQIVDVTHEVRPQDVRGGAFVLHTAYSYFPPGSIHIAVVDPGVGTDRAGVILDTGEALFVAPDNGLLTFVMAQTPGTAPRSHEVTKGEAREDSPLPLGEGQGEGCEPTTHRSLPPGWQAVRIAEPRFWLPEPSSTFHGRDIFAPVAAHLSLGEPLHSFGPRMDSLLAFSVQPPAFMPGGGVRGVVLHIDRFGNLITNLRLPDLPPQPFFLEAGAQRIGALSRTYADGRGLIALIGSSGYLEIALSGGSAHSALGAGIGAEVRAVPLDSESS